MSLESWATDKLSVFLGFDPETLKTQILPYLMTSQTPDALADELMGMVGTTEEALGFIQEFVARRFPPKPVVVEKHVKAPKITPKQTASPSTSSIPNSQSEGVFPSLPTNEQPYESMWPANINVQYKKEDEYFAGLKKSKKGKNKAQTNDLRAAAFPTENKQAAIKKEKKKVKNEMTLEDALKELDIKAEKPGKKRKPCQCQATKHPLLTAAPNCLSCGKIICTAEGVGPCTFCQAPVLSKEQQIALIAEAKKKRSDKKQPQTQSVKKVPAGGGMPAYSSKVGGSIYTSQYEDDENRLKAEEHKEKLLEFQRTSAQRSTVIDQATDFELPTDQANFWLSPQERALLIKKQQSNLRRVERKGDSSKRKVMTIDVQTKQVKMQDVEYSSSDEEEPVKMMSLSKTPKQEDASSAGTYAVNPLLKGIERPKFVGKHTKKTKGQLRRKERVQYDVDDVMNDYIYSTSLADDDTIDPVNEPITCQ
ncbi:putative zinc finger motif, C2HC5-type-domain-containing protein [Mucor mucedo]|uniref:putative zinc finger motif, C2HC5-type-domain-containing protein n=1 Tax=Mucor mucedo TaxID=29922 RepID=UPI00221E7C7C|nr:putative zinc finger motif, C2HC5-type-domain-containing protein [Mucor mucedo]KAI7891902.1 putative zinc finger motif, C2HC5-type-domain-containing protein [Mucor mucedo]